MCSLSYCLQFIMLLLNWIILAGGEYFPIKASLNLSQESMLFLGKDRSHSLALPLKEKGKSLSLTISPSTCLYFCISQSSTKLFKCKATSYLAPDNCSFITRLSKARLISYEGGQVAGGAIGVHIKSLLL